LEYRISQEIFESHPTYCRGVIVIDDVDNTSTEQMLAPLLRDSEARVRDLVRGDVAGHPYIAAWRKAYRKFGAKPSEHRSSIEAMVRRVVKPDSLPSINPLVDIGNVISLRHLLPVGVHPLTGAMRSLQLRRAMPDDTFVSLGGAIAETPSTGEIVLASGSDVLTRRWVWRQAANTQTLSDTTLVFYNVDGLEPSTPDVVCEAMSDVVRLVSKHCGGRIVASSLLTIDSPSMCAVFD
jgi:DNA/RNA-binding domain of Phe-tRNA-synthetase-like protein